MSNEYDKLFIIFYLLIFLINTKYSIIQIFGFQEQNSMSTDNIRELVTKNVNQKSNIQ